MDCLSCLSNNGTKRISPAEPIFIGEYWRVEHAYPTGLLGWMVIVLSRHCEKLHELKEEEWTELSKIQFKTVDILNRTLNTEKEYSCCFAEVPGFNHIHFHIIPKTAQLPNDKTGTKIFHYLKVDEKSSVNKETLIRFCKELNSLYKL